MTDLIPRYPGAKSNRTKYPVWDGTTYDLAYVPFAGSGRWCIPALQMGHVRALSVADADPAVREVWEMFVYHALGDFFHGRVNHWLERLATDEAKQVFDELCDVIDYQEYSDIHDYACAKILLHKLCFGGNVRSNSQGKLNISLRKDWQDAIQDWHYELPWLPPGRQVTIHDDWSKCFDVAFNGKTIAFIDPPYYAPGNGPRVKGGMSKAYSVHGGNPNDLSVLDMLKGAVTAAVEKGCDRIVATNYWGHWLQTIEHTDQWSRPKIVDQQWVEYSETTDFMQSMGFEWFHDLGPLQSMNNINFSLDKAGTTEQRTVRHEGWWEKGRTRQHGRVVQTSLLELIA